MLMSSSGFPGTAITSAKYPAFSSPICPPHPKSFAPFSKSDFNTSSGDIPNFAINTSSRACIPCGNGPTSEPTAKEIPTPASTSALMKDRENQTVDRQLGDVKMAIERLVEFARKCNRHRQVIDA